MICSAFAATNHPHDREGITVYGLPSQRKSYEYILTDAPNFNPNIGSTQTWERMERKS